MAGISIKTKRIYEKPEKEDGFRILVDRLWPRGLKKDDAAVDLWFRDIAPSNELRKWFAHDTSKWNEFREKYKEELEDKPALLKTFNRLVHNQKNITLLFSAKDEIHNNAVVLKDFIQ
ncbi:MAG: DUF488 domain-containing protein [Desulforhabdus sp.]|jgi:uncharacterized protein YeaO (DUF488 family)|nr:DUF488 domain-containing protein [Desulforhabdus sp.]